MTFPTDYESIIERLKLIDPEGYSKTRNFKDGALTYLSPYISRGVLSTKVVFDHIEQSDLAFGWKQKLIQELTWRDYWQQVWRAKGDLIDADLRHPQEDVKSHQIPSAIVSATTGIAAVDIALKEFYETGYMHNHMRMYVASLACNIGKSHWKEPARWMYAHLLDGDWASNALSWQWVAGSNANKKYIANQENINKYFYTSQQGSYLDVAYDEFPLKDIPEVLIPAEAFRLETILPDRPKPMLHSNRQTLVYNYYNLDPLWYKDQDVQRVLLLEPSFFKRYPVNEKCLDFALQLAQNVPDIKVYVGEFSELETEINSGNAVYKEHPTNLHYTGRVEPREWIFEVEGYFRSFFAFWKKCKKQL